MDTSKRAIGRRIKERREAVGLTQVALGQRVGRSQKQISDWEAGLAEPEDAAMMGTVARALDTTVGYLSAGERGALLTGDIPVVREKKRRARGA